MTGRAAALFERYGYPAAEALTRARVLYYMQIGYNDADLQETMEARQAQVGEYVRVFTGQTASEDELARFRAQVEAFSL